jgi:hypothetical protein
MAVKTIPVSKKELLETLRKIEEGVRSGQNLKDETQRFNRLAGAASSLKMLREDIRIHGLLAEV